MTLFYLGEMTMKEISKFLGVSVKTISSRLSRARKRLREKEDALVQEVLGGVQISANLTQNVMQQVADLRLTPPSATKPLIPLGGFWRGCGFDSIFNRTQQPTPHPFSETL